MEEVQVIPQKETLATLWVEEPHHWEEEEDPQGEVQHHPLEAGMDSLKETPPYLSLGIELSQTNLCITSNSFSSSTKPVPS